MGCHLFCPEPDDLPAETLQDTRDLHEVFMQCLETFVHKNVDYGSSWKQAGLVGVLVRLQDKLARALTLSKNGMAARVKDERLEDTLMDAITYMGMAVIWLRRRQNGGNEKGKRP